ncbi:uncharacterized protein J4E88_006570 [Alternaria novae-zelandiae]|uniref:uncharacterized protein n=1 Tax=Alternaria novae-zelandiae TaxID=430562 RepID=UPI0020C46115|nr:uncharacterized protein J4E88_006570 [Alternaria novae-zelandiae]KAI4678052.1 hypothetical protein J4E88_006570 [Alternaria novae-zelandiae]
MDLDTVTVRVGEAESAVNITVYRNLLSDVSPYFRGAFEGSFVEATDRFISLTDVTEHTFRMFLQWVHTQVYEHSSGATIPSPAILLHGSTTKNAGNTTTGPVEVQPPHPTQSVPDAETLPDATSALDELDGHQKRWDVNEIEGLCSENSELINGYRLSLLSFLRLYVFADKYNVPQLRDDVLTALTAQSISWCWWPDIERELMESAYAALPSSSKFIRLLVLSTAYCWLSQPGTSSATKMRAMKEMNEEFAFEVMVVQNQRLKDGESLEGMPSEGMPFWLEEAMPDSCTLHEHLARDAAKCRERICDQPYIFTGLIEMCAQDALSMAKESDEG